MDMYPLQIKEKEQRIVWSAVRATLEAFRFKHKRSGKKARSNWNLFEKLLSVFEFFLRVTGTYQKGLTEAKNIQVKKVILSIPDVPKSFEGFRILHLSDLHIDAIAGLEDILIEKITPLRFDLCVITGDFRKDTTGSFFQIMPAMHKLLRVIKPPYGILAVLGNHDTFEMVDALESLGLRFLVNESVQIKKNNENILITGIDDTYYFYTDMALHAIEKEKNDFSILLSHTSELSDVAADNGYKLYLCGHTHGGQICLPGGIPVISHQKSNKKQVRGLWKQDEMIGYTSPGAGVSGIPLRYNCPPEITLIELRNRTF